jgi:hypothetical protein
VVVKIGGRRTEELITKTPKASDGATFGSGVTVPTASLPGTQTDAGPAWRPGDGVWHERKRAKRVLPAIWASVLIAFAMSGEAYTLWSMPKHTQPGVHCDAPGIPLQGVGGVTYQAASGGRTPSMLSTSDIVNLMSTSVAPAFGSISEPPGVAAARNSGAGDGVIRGPPAKAAKHQ